MKKKLILNIEENEYWWGGNVSQGSTMPWSRESEFSLDLLGNNQGNQSQPLLISTKGRWIWCHDPMKFTFKEGMLRVVSQFNKIHTGQAADLPSAHKEVRERFFPSSGTLPHEMLFTQPQYNTWIELMYDQNEKAILNYAQSIIENGFPPGVLMIDDTWQENYGVWEFAPRRFKDPRGMINKLHDMGFLVMLWTCPFVSADSSEYRRLAKEGCLVMADEEEDVLWANTKNLPAIVRWWNGASAVVDLSHPAGLAWYKSRLDYLVETYGVDGFKFDAGDARFYSSPQKWHNCRHANEQMELFARMGLDYPLNELRASWKLAGQPLAQRLRDKQHDWEGLQKLIPEITTQANLGYAYTCADMIGGGEYQSFLKTDTIDQELVVRSAQCSALLPMMQFSVSPWRVLSAEYSELCRKAALLHTQYAPLILELAKKSSRTGEPIIRSMAFQFPGQGLDRVLDQFALGDNILVAPVLEKGAKNRIVRLPEGRWEQIQSEGEKTVHRGNREISVAAPLDYTPIFTRRP